jgi:hypothetical protein
LFGVPVKAFKGSIVDDSATAWEEIEPLLTGTTDAQGKVTWKCDKCLPQGEYTIIAKYQEQFQVSQISDSNSGWNTECSGVVEQRLAFSEDIQAQQVVDDYVTVSYGRVMYNRRTGQYSYTATITNNSDVDLEGPVWLVIQNLQPDVASVANANGSVNGNPYIEALGTGASLQSGESISNVTLLITNPSRLRITFDDQVLAVLP